MDKEKEIQELERLICPFGYNFNYKNCSECEYYHENNEEEEDTCDLDCVVEAQNIYNKGYRKIDEKQVRINIEKGIALDIIDLIDSMDGWNNYSDIIDAIKEQYKIDY